MTDAEILQALTEEDVTALTLYGEGRGVDVLGRVAVGCVIRNRVLTKYRGATYRAVCLAPRQFSCWNEADPNRGVLLDAARGLLAGEDFPAPVLRECLWIANGVVSGACLDPTKRSRHYHHRGVSPAWATGHQPVYVALPHVFYNEVP